MSRWRSYELSGRDVVSPTGFLVLLGFSLTSIFIANPDLQYANATTLLTIAVAAQIFLFLLLIAWRWLLSVWGRQANGVEVVLVFAFVSLVRAIAVSLALEVSGVTDSVEWGLRLASAVPGFTAALVIADIALGSLRRHRQQTALLRARQEKARFTRDETLQAIAEERDSTVRRVQDALFERIQYIARSDPHTALDSLRSAGADVVRPLSRMLAEAAPALRFIDSDPVPTGFGIRAFLSDATAGRPLSPRVTAVLFLVFASPFLVINFDAWPAILIGVVAVVIILATLAVGNAIYVRIAGNWTIPSRLALLAGLIIASGALLALPSQVLVSGSPDLVKPIMFASTALMDILAIATICAHGARELDGRIIGQLEEAAVLLERASARAHCLNWLEHRSLARAMHGPVQNAVWGAAAQLEQAIDQGQADPELLSRLQAQVLASLVQADDRSVGNTDPGAALEALAQTWAGACEISWDIDGKVMVAIKDDPLAGFAAREITSEACWNAIRHGHAANIRAYLDIIGADTVRIRVVDDGAVEPQDDTPGIGTAMIEDMSIRWQRKREGESTIFEADIAFEVASPAWTSLSV
ncbi:MAG: hypothetical protein WCJ73_02485 [Actinomycetes bacterium]